MNHRLYFDLTSGLEVIRDTEGVEAAALGEAIEEAQSALNEMRISEAKMPADGWELIVRDESGLTLGAIALDDAFQERTASVHAAPLQALQRG